MNINCPICGVVLELPDDVEAGRHILCPYCDKKFYLQVAAMPVAGEEKMSMPSTFTPKEIDSAIEKYEQTQFEKTSPWKRKYKGNVWIKALELMLVLGVVAYVQDNVTELFAPKDYVLETVKDEIGDIRSRIDAHAKRMRSNSLDFVITSENGRYPYLWAEKEPARVWNTLKLGISYMEDQIEWLKEYQPKGRWNNPKAQARYDRFNKSRQEMFNRSIAFYEAQLRMAYATQKLFAAYYLTNSVKVNHVEREIMRLYPNGFSDIDSCSKEFSIAAQECGKAEELYLPYIKNFKWQFDKFD